MGSSIPHKADTCTCPACVYKRDSTPPKLEGLSYLNKTNIMRVVSVERGEHGHWYVNIEHSPRPGYEKYYDGKASREDQWGVDMWNDQVIKHKGVR